MAPFIFGFLLLLGCCFRAALPNEYRNNASSRNLRKDAGYGRPIIAMANSPRCTFNGKPVDDGKSVSSPEPCLNCTCSKGILLCYLRTCNSVSPIQGCQVVKKPGTCCPQLECGDDSLGQSNDLKTDLHDHKYHLRQDDGSFFGLLPMDPRTDRSAITDPTTRKPFPYNWNMKEGGGPVKGQRRSEGESQLHYEQEEDYGEDDLEKNNNTAGYCISRGYKYTEGMAMLSPTKCEYCYCIGGQQMCVRPKCHLNIEGCVPRYQSGYTCCPSHYNCEIASGVSSLGNDDENYQLISGNFTQYKTKATSCTIDGYDFDVGVAVPSSGHCQTCYCTKKGVICKRLECSPNVPGCTPVIPEGHCCPTQYKCDQKIINSTHVPVAHSTDNYDVTVISTSDEEDRTSSQASRTEYPDVYTNSDQESSTTETEDSETITGSSNEKQKITLELSEESDLESISVIPEENIAVLVLTTEREGSENLSDDSSKAETIRDSNSHEEESTITETISTSNAKRKSKPTKSNIKVQSRNHTLLSIADSVTKPTSLTTDDQGTTHEASDTSEKDSYAYDYVEYLDDESPNNLQTFDPFSEYSLQPHDETIFTEEDRETSTITQLRNKIKEKRPPINAIFNKPNSGSDVNAFREEHPDYRNTKTSTKNDETVFSTTSRIDNVDNLSDSPGRYTIYGTDRTRPDIADYSEYLTTRHNSVQKQKHRRPGIVTKYQTTYLRPQSTRPFVSSTGSVITSEDVRTAQTIPYDPTADRNTYTAESYTQTYGPHIRPNFSNKKHSSNRRRRPDKLPQTTSSRQSTRPIPQDIADFLWSITQSQNTQTAPTVGQGTTIRNNNVGQGYVSETVPPIVLAAPKLILEESTSKSTYGTTQTESTNVPTNPDSPSFNFQPEIIFSNHGPSHNRKPPQRVPELPLIINNHKKTSTRLRPPVRFRPSSTQPSLEDTFVEISNHRPTNSHRRPPSKFPPYPHPAYRPDQGYNRDPHFRDQHPKLHRFNSDARPQWSEDYEEYYYDTDHDMPTTTKMHKEKHKTMSETDTSSTDSSPTDIKITHPLTENDSLTTDAISTTNSESSLGEFTTQIKSGNFSTDSTEPNIGNNVANEIHPSRFSENKTDQTVTETTKEKLTTTPFPRSTYYLPTLTTTTSVPYDTTKTFSGYVRNKHRGTSSINSDGKFFRAEDDSKRWDTGPSDHRLIEYNKKPTDTFNSHTQTTSEKPPELSTESPTPPSKSDDSKEITDVCFVDGRYYISGETIIKANPCEMCSCFYGHPLCQVQQCPPPPDPSCALDYLPGYCCPRVTCGLQTDPEQPPGIVSISAPEPTSQEIRPSPIQLDNQWKPLPHGPITRTTESNLKVESPTNENKEVENNSSDELVTLETKMTIKDNTDVAPTDSKFELSDALVLSNNLLTTQPSTTTTNFVTSTPTPTTTHQTTTDPPATEETSTAAQVTEAPPETTTPQSTTTKILPPEDLITTTSPTTTLPTPTEAATAPPDSNEPKGAQNKSLIHDNSSGVRKVLDEVVTLPPSKVALSESVSGSEVDTVLPVIGTLAPTTISADEVFGIQSVTLGGADVVGVSTELGNLKVSGCNVYGKYYKINDKVTALGKHCSECICTADGISCNTIC